MAAFKRGLSKDCADALQRLAAEPSGNWWKEVLANKDLLLAVRGGYLNAYVKGQSVFKIGPSVQGGKPCVETHYKYLVTPEMEEGSPYIQFDGRNFAIDPANVIQSHYETDVTLKRLVRTAARFSVAEKEGVHRIAANEPKVVDVEIAFTRTGDPNQKPTAPRMDLAVLIPEESKGARLVFCEAKCADNDQLWKLEKIKPSREDRRIAAVAQIEEYETFIGASSNYKAIIDAYVGVCGTLVNLHQQGWKRKLNPLVEAVAKQQIPLIIHPKVYLLVYSYDADEEKGAVRKIRDILGTKDRLGHRVITKGDPREFALSEDILRYEANARRSRSAIPRP